MQALKKDINQNRGDIIATKARDSKLSVIGILFKKQWLANFVAHRK